MNLLPEGVCNWCGEHKDERRPYLYGIRLCTECIEAHKEEWVGMPDMAKAVLIKNGVIES